MNYKMVGFVLGRIFLIEAALMLFPMGCAAIYGEWSVVLSFLWPALIVLALGLITSLRTPQNTKIYARDGLAIVALVWVLMSVFGAMPFVISGEIPSFADAFFETVSGFTTTGSTILTDVEALSHGTLFWRSFSHWIGGMGVLVFAMAVLPMTDGRAMHLMRAEVPGPTCGKISSKLSDSAKILYAIYFVMTVIETILLCAGGMPLFDALIHAFGTAGTGGFSNKALSVGAYNSPYFEIVIGVFMLLFGINFNLYYFLLLRHFREAFASEEMHVYLGIVAFSTLTITANIASMYDSVGTALRTAFFQVSSIVTTTGYATADFNLWPTYSRIVIVILTFVGACAGSTAGGLKVSRVIILFKAARQDLNKMLHSHAVTTVRFEGKPLDEKTLRGVHNYFNIYMLLLTLSVLLLSLDGFDLVTTFTSVATCLNNVGPGLEMVGPMGSFADFSAPAKLLLAFDMLAGRLELYPMLALFAPRLWRAEGERTFVYDPETPVPSHGAESVLTTIAEAGSLLQPEPDYRPDVVSFVSAPLEKALPICGQIKVHLNVSTDVDDTAFTAKLMEVFPDGRAYNIRGGITTIAADLPEGQTYTPGQTAKVCVEMWDMNWTVQPGSCLRLDVSSSDFPQYAVHSNYAGVWSEQGKTRIANQKILLGEGSFVELPLHEN